MSDTLTLIKPDDWHVHFREGDALANTVPASASLYQRVMVMPNLQTPVKTVQQAREYRTRILNSLPADFEFEPLMTLYLTEETSKEEIREASRCGFINAIKLYPAGATTHSSAGVHSIDRCTPQLEIMQTLDLPLSVHGEVTDPDIDIFNRENVFIERTLTHLVKRYPELRIVFEHLSTGDAVDFVLEASSYIGSTITPHHLLLTRNDLLVGGIKPHLYCLPIVKTEKDRQKLISAATSGNPKFFLGSDSAPHPQRSKEKNRGSAGIYSAPYSLQLYAELFESVGKLVKLEGFASQFGADFYKLPRNQTTITLQKKSFTIPETLTYADEHVIPLYAGDSVSWSLSE